MNNQELSEAVERIKIADSYGLDLVAILQGDCDPQMIRDVVLIARAYIASMPVNSICEPPSDILLAKGWRSLTGGD